MSDDLQKTLIAAKALGSIEHPLPPRSEHDALGFAPPRLTVFERLMKARVDLQAMPLKKSGHNKFAGYSYFELGDFLPAVQQLFAKYGLCDVITFERDGDGQLEAIMRIYDTTGEDCINFRSPFGSAELKGCHEVQNIGAVQTYQRRYLYTTALAISEHDALDATLGSEPPAKKKQANQEAPKPPKQDGMTDEDKALFVDKLLDWGSTCQTVQELTDLWKGNQASIDQVKGNADLFSKLTKGFGEIKTALITKGE
ncbi:Essential recombination function protein [uncultured Caudovirales phage]|uniref:Essential recombination function protein n=1 Tax=uncultured Caudovirales phage TaxID=2100421 RepID=A0A6J5LSX4_9CAUD|nr:Essential recombination function protein [uncultured Caudovirales phage]